MSTLWIGIIGLVALFVLIFEHMPIGFVMALVGFVGYMYIDGLDTALSQLSLISFGSVASFSFRVIPLFILMGNLASASGIIDDAYKSAHALLGQLRGGLARELQ